MNAVDDLRSEDVESILGRTPGWLTKWGNSVLLLIIVLGLALCWIIKFPDSVTARVLVTTQTPPSSIVARSSGRLHLVVKNEQHVKKGDILGFLENTAHQPHILALQEQLDHFDPSGIGSNELFSKSWQLGELQDAYVDFLTTLNNAFVVHERDIYSEQIYALERRIAQYKLLGKQLLHQHHLLKRELALASAELSRDSILFHTQIISQAAWESEQAAYLQIARGSQAGEIQMTNNLIEISKLETQIAELSLLKQTEQFQSRKAIEGSLQALKSELANWEQKYVLRTPINGRVSLIDYWSDAQFVQANDDVMAVVPESESLLGKALMPIAGSGKVEVGQKVYLKFDNYPAAEFGSVLSKVASISAVPRDNYYIIEIELPQSLVTTYRKKLPFKQEMQGSAEIITEDLRLIERVFHQVRKILDKA